MLVWFVKLNIFRIFLSLDTIRKKPYAFKFVYAVVLFMSGIHQKNLSRPNAPSLEIPNVVQRAMHDIFYPQSKPEGPFFGAGRFTRITHD